MPQVGAPGRISGEGSAGAKPSSPARDASASDAVPDYPVREYVAAMSGELARMARWDGDERLALLLEIAARLAAEPQDDLSA